MKSYLKMTEPPDKKRCIKWNTNGEVLDYQTALKFGTWESERELADQIMDHVHKHNLNFKLDKLTRGEGNCFMIAVMQQLQQDHVYQVSGHHIKCILKAIHLN